MKNKFCAIAIILIMTMLLSSCSIDTDNLSQTQAEEPHLYWKDIDVVVEEISYKHWYASGHHYIADVTVKSEEYGLTETFCFKGLGAARFEGVRVGDIVEAELYSWVMDSDGQIVRRSIARLY